MHAGRGTPGHEPAVGMGRKLQQRKSLLGFHSSLRRVGEMVRWELPCLLCRCRQLCGQWLLLGARRAGGRLSLWSSSLVGGLHGG